MPEAPPVLITLVTMPWPTMFLWTFDQFIVGYNTNPDPVFEVWHPVNGWFSPISWANKFPGSIGYNYPVGAQGATLWRVLGVPTQVWWTPLDLPVPQNGSVGP